MKKRIYGLIKYNYEINKKRNIFFKYYDFYLQEEKTISLKYFKDIQDCNFYPNRGSSGFCGFFPQILNYINKIKV